MRWFRYLPIAAALLTMVVGAGAAHEYKAAASPPAVLVAVAPQYDSTHVYVTPADFDAFVSSVLATFGGSKSPPGVIQVTPTPSQTMWQLLSTPVGTLSVFGFKTPIPYPFGLERTGYLVTDLDVAIQSAQKLGADIIVSPFPDAIGRDAIIEWPGGLHMQLYWHTKPPDYKPLETVPENRVYVSSGSAATFVRDFVRFSQGAIALDEPHAPGLEIGRPNDTFRRVQIDSRFGKMVVFVTDGHLPFPYGRETTGYEVKDLAVTLARATAAGAAVLVPGYQVGRRRAAVVQFPGGYIAELHDFQIRQE
jgi:hypothetical protein